MGKLFWKIFGWFTLLIFALSMLFYSLSGERLLGTQTERGRQLLADTQRVQLEAVGQTLEQQGLKAGRELAQKLAGIRPRIWVLDARGDDILGRDVPLLVRSLGGERKLERTAQAPNGERYHLFTFQVRHSEAPLKAFRDDYPQLLRLIAFFAIAALASAGVAWYIARPLKLLSARARNLRDGGRHAPLRGDLKGRRDELSELAADFDAMASALAQREQALQQLINDVSHELRSPLSRVRLNLALLAQQQRPLDAQSSADIERELERLDELIDQVLTLAKLDNQPHFAHSDHLELNTLLQQLTTQLTVEAQASHCQFEVNCAEDELTLCASAELLHRAFENLLRNAIKYSPAGGSITVEVKHAERADCARIEICDSGPGVDATALPHLFDPFYRGDSSRSSAGYGLGLAICRRAIECHGGHIQARNNGPLGGLQVTVELPLLEFQQHPTELKEANTES